MIELLRNYPFPFKLKNKLRNQDGFIAIMALGLFALLAVFSFIVSGIFRSTVRSIQDTNDYLAAQDINNSIVEFILFDLNSRGPGYNSGVVICEFDEDGELSSASLGGAESQEISDYCTNNFGDILPEGKEVKIEFAVQGRSEEEDSIETDLCVTSSGGWGGLTISPCYVVPSDRNGSASFDCSDYPPPNGTDIEIGGDTIDQLDYSCNWNIIQVGNQEKSEIIIPLYYDYSTAIDAAEETFEPFHSDNIPFEATDGLILKVRTPCMDGSTTCEAASRYAIDNDLLAETIVTWYLSGECDGSSCEFQPSGNVITGQVINDAAADNYTVLNYSQVATPQVGTDFSANPTIFNYQDGTYVDGNDDYTTVLPFLNEPHLHLEVDKLILDDSGGGGEIIPYLEYQLLTSKQVSDIRNIITVEVEVDGNVSQRTYHQNYSNSAVNAVLDF